MADKFLLELIEAQRELEKSNEMPLKSTSALERKVERIRQEYEIVLRKKTVATFREQKAWERQKSNLYADLRMARVELENEQLQQKFSELEDLLHIALAQKHFIILDSLKRKPPSPGFEPSIRKPFKSEYYVPPPGRLRKLLPGVQRRYEEQRAEAHRQYLIQRKQYEVAKQQHEQRIDRIRQGVENQHAAIDRLKDGVLTGKPEDVTKYFTLVLVSSSYPDNFPRQAKLAYGRDSKELVVEFDLPPLDVIPEISSYQYVKSRDIVKEIVQPITKRKKLYSSVIAQITLRTIYELFDADQAGNLEVVVFNGYVDAIDLGTGRSIRPCLVTVRVTKEVFQELDLHKVDPETCLKTLKASISNSPTELAPVRPILEFSMVDPRFVREVDILSELDHRQNLMELSPKEFETLIANLFNAMGLETRQTQLSRDGGVDCVAYDSRPILGGKVVIQAKRYKNTVGVSAVRDLYGTVVNEGASKGILVTTSGYGKASYEFAKDKPLELLSGSHLLFLLAKYAGIEAKIVPPEDWQDPVSS